MRVDGEQFRGYGARHHQPLGVLIDDVIARERQLAWRRDACHVDPRVHAKSGGMRLADRFAEGIEGVRSGSSIVDRLHEQGVEPGSRRRRHHLADRCFGVEAGATDPQCANFIAGAGGVHRGDVRHQRCGKRA